jgi:ELWxxDGT repeat protein
MVKDIATVQQNAVPSWPFYPGPMTEMSGVYYFRASDGVHGVELFRTDLTAAADIAPGSNNSYPRSMKGLGKNQ